MRRRAGVLVVVLAVAAGCSDDGVDTGDPGCDIWVEFLAEDDVSTTPDAEAAQVGRQVADAAEDPQVRLAATAFAARLEDHTPLGNSMTVLGEACGLVD